MYGNRTRSSLLYGEVVKITTEINIIKTNINSKSQCTILDGETNELKKLFKSFEPPPMCLQDQNVDEFVVNDFILLIADFLYLHQEWQHKRNQNAGE